MDKILGVFDSMGAVQYAAIYLIGGAYTVASMVIADIKSDSKIVDKLRDGNKNSGLRLAVMVLMAFLFAGILWPAFILLGVLNKVSKLFANSKLFSEMPSGEFDAQAFNEFDAQAFNDAIEKEIESNKGLEKILIEFGTNHHGCTGEVIWAKPILEAEISKDGEAIDGLVLEIENEPLSDFYNYGDLVFASFDPGFSDRRVVRGRISGVSIVGPLENENKPRLDHGASPFTGEDLEK